jgi:hypothetical protein
MRKIFSFSDFSALYEAEDPKIYEQNLKIVVSDLLALYYEMTEYGAYTDAEIDSDLQTIVAGSSLADKSEAFKNIMSKVNQKALSTDKNEGAKELFEIIDSAYNKYLEALNYIVNKYKDSKEESDSMIAFVNKEIEAYKAFLDEETSESNSNFYGYSQIFEGKKSLLSDAENTVNSLRGKIDSYKMDADPRKKKFATDADLEIVKIANSIKSLKDKKNKDIEKSEIEKIFNDLATLGTNFDTGINKIIDENTTDAELEKLRNKARDVKDQISPLRNKYLKNKSTADAKGKSEKITVSLDKDRIEYDPEETKNVNPEVKKFQELVTDAFKDVKSITDLSFYKKMGTDGKFGPNTRDMVKTLKGAFELSDKSGDITKELSDEIQIQKDTIKESISSRVYRFSSFVNVSEAAFNLSKGLEVAKSLKTYKSSGSGSGITSAAKGAGGKMKNVASSKEIEEAEGTKFNDKTSEEKWKWLTDTYKAGFDAEGKSAKVSKVETGESSGEKYLTIWWDDIDPSTKRYNRKTTCYYPKDGKLGEYKDTNYYSEFVMTKSSGVWGNKIDVEKKSASGNFLEKSAIKEEDREKFKLQAINVAWLYTNFKTSFEKFGSVKRESNLTDGPWLRFKINESFVAGESTRKTFYKGQRIDFFGSGRWYLYEGKEGGKSILYGTWQYAPNVKDAITMTRSDAGYGTKSWEVGTLK